MDFALLSSRNNDVFSLRQVLCNANRRHRLVDAVIFRHSFRRACLKNSRHSKCRLLRSGLAAVLGQAPPCPVFLALRSCVFEGGRQRHFFFLLSSMAPFLRPSLWFLFIVVSVVLKARACPRADQPAQSPATVRMRGQLLRGFGCLAAPARLCPDARGLFTITVSLFF